jgi:hypothetical protein
MPLTVEDVILEVAQALHAQDFGGHHRKKWANTEWKDMPDEGVYEYVDRAEPVLRAAIKAGFVIIPQSEVNQAWIPRKPQSLIRPRIKLSGRVDIG